jgi:hypothetical protein
MNPKELFHADGHSAGVFFCGQCRAVHGQLELAEQCCSPYRCEQCGVETKRYWMICDACRSAKQERSEQMVWENSTKVPEAEWNGPVWDEFNDSFHDSIEEFVDEWQCDHGPEDTRPRVYACFERKMSLDAERLVENALEDMHEDAYDELAPGWCAELQQALDAWVEKHSPVTWVPDRKRAIVWEPREDGWAPEDEPTTIEVEFGGEAGEVARVETATGEMTIERVHPPEPEDA